MPGMPVRRKMIADLEDAGGLEVAVFDRLRDGESLEAIAQTFGVSRSFLWRYLKKDRDRYATYQRARRLGIASNIERAQENLTNAVEHAKEHANVAHVQAVCNEAGFRKWHAGVTDRKNFGPPEHRTSLNVNVENLHLGALQHTGGPEAQVLSGESVDVPLLEPGDTDEVTE